jgi:DNA replication protein DnaC
MTAETPNIVTIACAAGCGRLVELDFSDEHWRSGRGRQDRDKIVAAASSSRCSDCMADELEAERARRAQAHHHELQLRAGIPPLFSGLGWADMDRSNGRDVVIDEAARWAADDGADLFIHSRAGTGKTRLAAIAAQARLARLKPLRWVNAPTLFLKANADFRSDERAEAEEILFNRDPLVLDDLGKENPTEWSRGVLITALDTRIEHGIPVLITSNLTVPELAAKYTFTFDSGDWLASRLAGYFRQYQMPGIDRRLQLVP